MAGEIDEILDAFFFVAHLHWQGGRRDRVGSGRFQEMRRCIEKALTTGCRLALAGAQMRSNPVADMHKTIGYR